MSEPQLPRGIAALNQGALALRRSVSGEPRSALCGMGSCHECRDRDGGRTCLPRSPSPASTPRRLSCEVAIFGAGPAGLAAAQAAASRGARVVLVDDQASPGGQVWRGEGRSAPRGSECIANASVLQVLGPNRVQVSAPSETIELEFSRAVLCTGATELFLPFPGWTLPGVHGAGGLQALVKHGLEIRGRRVVLAGSGPLLLAVAALLRARGAAVLCVLEQAPWSRVRGLYSTLASRPGKLAQAARLGFQLRGIPRHHAAWVTRAEGDERLRAVHVRIGAREERIACDVLGVGFGLVPRTQLAQAFGCKLTEGCVAVDERQETSVPGLYAAGECTGIGGLDKALTEGRLAGLAAGGSALPRAARSARQREQAFAAALQRAFALDPALRELAEPQTIVCRCEDVRMGDLAGLENWREARLYARVGMGPCQGAVCGPALAFLRGYAAQDARPPLSPVPLLRLSERAP